MHPHNLSRIPLFVALRWLLLDCNMPQIDSSKLAGNTSQTSTLASPSESLISLRLDDNNCQNLTSFVAQCLDNNAGCPPTSLRLTQPISSFEDQKLETSPDTTLTQEDHRKVPLSGRTSAFPVSSAPTNAARSGITAREDHIEAFQANEVTARPGAPGAGKADPNETEKAAIDMPNIFQNTTNELQSNSWPYDLKDYKALSNAVTSVTRGGTASGAGAMPIPGPFEGYSDYSNEETFVETSRLTGHQREEGQNVGGKRLRRGSLELLHERLFLSDEANPAPVAMPSSKQTTTTETLKTVDNSQTNAAGSINVSISTSKDSQCLQSTIGKNMHESDSLSNGPIMDGKENDGEVAGSMESIHIDNRRLKRTLTDPMERNSEASSVASKPNSSILNSLCLLNEDGTRSLPSNLPSIGFGTPRAHPAPASTFALSNGESARFDPSIHRYIPSFGQECELPHFQALNMPDEGESVSMSHLPHQDAPDATAAANESPPSVDKNDTISLLRRLVSEAPKKATGVRIREVTTTTPSEEIQNASAANGSGSSHLSGIIRANTLGAAYPVPRGLFALQSCEADTSFSALPTFPSLDFDMDLALAFSARATTTATALALNTHPASHRNGMQLRLHSSQEFGLPHAVHPGLFSHSSSLPSSHSTSHSNSQCISHPIAHATHTANSSEFIAGSAGRRNHELASTFRAAFPPSYYSAHPPKYQALPPVDPPARRICTTNAYPGVNIPAIGRLSPMSKHPVKATEEASEHEPSTMKSGMVDRSCVVQSTQIQKESGSQDLYAQIVDRDVTHADSATASAPFSLDTMLLPYANAAATALSGRDGKVANAPASILNASVTNASSLPSSSAISSNPSSLPGSNAGHSSSSYIVHNTEPLLATLLNSSVPASESNISSKASAATSSTNGSSTNAMDGYSSHTFGMIDVRTTESHPLSGASISSSNNVPLSPTPQLQRVDADSVSFFSQPPLRSNPSTQLDVMQDTFLSNAATLSPFAAVIPHHPQEHSFTSINGPAHSSHLSSLSSLMNIPSLTNLYNADLSNLPKFPQHHQQLPSQQRPLSTSIPPFHPPGQVYTSHSKQSKMPQPRPGKGKPMPPEVTTILIQWVLQHSNHPYPSRSEKIRLQSITGLSAGQLRGL